MNGNLVIITLVTHFLTIGVLAVLWKRTEVQKTVSVVANFLVLMEGIYLLRQVLDSGMAVMQSGNWPAPFGISFVLDTFSATLLLLTAIAGFAVSIFSTVSLTKTRIKYGYFPVFHFLLLGLNGAFLTGDAFNLYVWFEIMIISSFVLLSLGAEKRQLEASVKYFALNFLASMLFLTALGILYGLTGTLNMADVAVKMQAVENTGLREICALFFLVGFGIKSGLFPMYFWLPASYHTPPSAVTAIFGGLLTKVGVYAIIRMFTLIFADLTLLHEILLFLGTVTILSGAFGAISQKNIMKIYAYLLITHIGYMIGGFGLFSKVAVTGVVFYLIHDIVVKTNLFITGGLLYKITGTYDYRQLGGIYHRHPYLSLLILVPMLSLAGVPPLSGFWPKVPLVQASAGAGSYFYLFSLIFGSLVTLLVIARLWSEVFWKKKPISVRPAEWFVYYTNLTPQQKMRYILPVVFLAVISLMIGFGAEAIYRLSDIIATELTDPQEYYINKILR